jgi:tRNA U34 2-thiouridine synthase MnmA/TrmU
MRKIKALGLFSGGFDSLLASLILKEQGIKIFWITFASPFFNNYERCKKFSKIFKIPLKKVDITKKFLKMLINPRYGYGSALNPCMDCHILMLKEAKKYAKKIKADFIFTGEVLGERPFTQNKKQLKIIEKEVGLEKKILRPLSAKLLQITEPEEKGLVDREKLYAIKGRRRNMQIELAKRFGFKKYFSQGGCILTQKEFAAKLNDLITFNKKITKKDIELLKIGRHFRSGKNKIVVGRNEKENKILEKMKGIKLKVPNFGSPTTLLQGKFNKEALIIAARLTARYSDCKEEKVLVEWRYGKKKGKLIVNPITEEEKEKIRIKWVDKK